MKRILNLISKYKTNAVVPLVQEQITLMAEPLATNNIHNKQKKQENIMQLESENNTASNDPVIEIPVRLVTEFILKDESIVDSLYKSIRRSILSDIDEKIEEIEEIDTSDFLTGDNVWDYISSDVDSVVEDNRSDITEDWLKDSLQTYSGLDGASLCPLGVEVRRAIIKTIRDDIDFVAKNINDDNNLDLRLPDGYNTIMFPLVKLIQSVCKNVVREEIRVINDMSDEDHKNSRDDNGYSRKIIYRPYDPEETVAISSEEPLIITQAGCYYRPYNREHDRYATLKEMAQISISNNIMTHENRIVFVQVVSPLQCFTVVKDDQTTKESGM